MARDNGDFIEDLRKEISSSKNLRTKYVLIKLSFIVGLLGVGSVRILNYPMTSLIYLTTLVVVVYDLYILGEDFAVKRAGRFIRGSPDAPSEEIRWETTVRANRDPVTSMAGTVSSLLVVLVAATSLWSSGHKNIFYIIWLIFSIMALFVVSIYGHSLVRKLKQLDKYLLEDGVDIISTQQNNTDPESRNTYTIVETENRMCSTKDALISDLQTTWQDHFHMRDQTWKVLQYSILFFLGAIGLEIKKMDPFYLLIAYTAVLMTSLFGVTVAIHHRRRQKQKIDIIKIYERELGLDVLIAPALAEDNNGRKIINISTSTYIIAMMVFLCMVSLCLLARIMFHNQYL